ncbi:MAG: response regulator transcription factor [Deltaproteobacteria bacterium]|nr:response regulator transcription factor [Deltaproteobacteria bacterium]
MAQESILAVDDEEDILELLRYNLAREGYRVTGAATGEEAVATARAILPDLILLDLLLPGVDGLEVCRRLKSDARTRPIPIIMLSAKGEEADIVAGLELGADDYVTKPFSPRVLLARIRTALRRRKAEVPSDTAPLKFKELVINPGRHEVLLAGQKLDLTVTEFHLLHLLARRPGWVFTRSQIVKEVHGEDFAVTERSVDVHIVGLRKKLGTFGKSLETVRGIGYRLKD